jgi:hypothetical protein
MSRVADLVTLLVGDDSGLGIFIGPLASLFPHPYPGLGLYDAVLWRVVGYGYFEIAVTAEWQIDEGAAIDAPAAIAGEATKRKSTIAKAANVVSSSRLKLTLTGESPQRMVTC